MHLRAVAVVRPPYAKSRYALVRVEADRPGKWFWCGRSLGWLPVNVTTSLHHCLYRTVVEAEHAILRYHAYPLP